MSNEKKPRVATEASTQNQPRSNFNVFGPVDKLKYLSIAASDGDLSRCDLAILFVIANGANSKTGLTWRSFNTMARETASTSRTAKRSVKKLLQKEYISIVKKGGLGYKANTYVLGALDLLMGSDAGVTNAINSLVTPITKSGDLDGVLDVVSMSPLSMTLSEPKARIERNRSSEGDASPCGVASASSGKRQPNGDMYPDFWNAFPFRAGVSAAEEILGKLIKDGIEYGVILAGAKRYAEYCKRSKIRTSADAWLRRESWRDEWTPYVDRSESKNIKNSKKENQKRRMRVPSDEYKNWKLDLGWLHHERSKARECWEDHYGIGNSQKPIRCGICFEFLWNKMGAYCDVGANLKLMQTKVEDRIKAHMMAEPEKELHYPD